MLKLVGDQVWYHFKDFHRDSKKKPKTVCDKNGRGNGKMNDNPLQGLPDGGPAVGRVGFNKKMYDLFKRCKEIPERYFKKLLSMFPYFKKLLCAPLGKISWSTNL